MATIAPQTPADARPEAGGQPAGAASEHAIAAALDRAVESLLVKVRTRRWGISRQSAEAGEQGEKGGGRHYCAELEGDSILSSEYLLMKWALRQERDDPRLLALLCNQLRLWQRPDGAWGQYPGAPADLSATVKAYFALKLFGESADAPHMERCRGRVLELGGAEKINTFSMFYLACLGQVSWDACPAIPPEIVLLPRWFPFHMDKVAAWTRTMILPLAICSALRPVREVPAPLGIDELFIDPRARTRLNQAWDRDEPLGWRNFFLVCDRALKLAQQRGLMPMRPRAIKAAQRWIVERVDPATTEGLGAIFPPMVYLQVAFDALGYSRDHPLMRQAEADLDDFIIEEPHADPKLAHARLQPCFSPVWDTGIALYALTEAGLTAWNDPRVKSVCDWLIDRQVTMTGDWIRNLRPEDRGMVMGGIEAERSFPGRGASAWAFEYRNEWYPDVDDTAMVAKALWRAAPPSSPDSAQPAHRSSPRDNGHVASSGVYRDTARLACRWILAMQNDDGGWAAFDRTRDRPWMEAVPFADHNAMQDPSCPDITGRVVEALVTCGVAPDDARIAAAVRYLLSHQHPDGWWRGRWGVNALYGTWQALGGLSHAAVPRDHPAMRRALTWLRGVQNADGGFGESANSYLDERLIGAGESTASQTAWGLASLLYLVDADDPGASAAATWLADHQLAADKPPFGPGETASGAADAGADDLAPTDHVRDLAGGWSEHLFSGTGFPKVFYLRYHLYRHYFPVMALARYRRLRG